MKRNDFKKFIGPQLGKFKSAKRLKTIVVIGLVGIVVTLSLTIWAGLSALGFVWSHLQSANMQAHVANLQFDTRPIASITSARCLQQATNLMSVEAWILNPLADNLNQIKQACLSSNSKSCVDGHCSEPHNQKKPSKKDHFI